MPHLAVNSGPGTGKTYTATGLTRYLRATNKDVFLKNNKHTDQQLAIWKWVEENIQPTFPQKRPPAIMYGAYNKDMIPEVQPHMPDTVECRTIHGHGYKLLLRDFGFLKINKNRGIFLVEKITGKNFQTLKNKFQWLATLRHIEKMKDELLELTEENFISLRNKYDDLANMPYHSEMVDQAVKLIEHMKKKPDRTIGIEYIDQVWLTLFVCKSPIYDLGIIDEAQDLSPARLLLCKRLCRNLVFVGDPDQAINAFAGADPHSFDKIQKFCDHELPLKISFRCPPNIIQKANAVRPRANLRGLDKPPGKELKLTINTLLTSLPENPSDALIICRYNAPLVSCALKLMKGKIPCQILGNSLADNLCKIVEGRKAIDLDDLETKLTSYEDWCTRDLKPHIAEMVRDKMDCIRLVIPHCESVDDVPDTIRDMFKPKKGQAHVTLSTIHKAKGKERKNVYILFPPIESEYATTPDQLEQEANLHFVAITRTIENLYWIHRE